MASCDRCGKKTYLRFLIVSERICEECHGPSKPFDWSGDLPKENIFDAYYDRAIGAECTSYSDQEKKIKQFNERQRNLPPEQRDHAHPDGVELANDDHKLMQDCKHASKNKEEMRRSMYPGYIPRSSKKYDSDRPDAQKKRKVYVYGKK